MCQSESLKNSNKRAVRRSDYLYWHGYVTARLSTAWRERRRTTSSLQEDAPQGDGGFFARCPPTIIAIEACGVSLYWARLQTGPGHEVKLIAPQLAKPYVKSSTNDAADAEAL